MSGPRIIALDVGSSSVRAVAYDEHGVAEAGDAHLAYAVSDADDLVAACRAVLDRSARATSRRSPVSGTRSSRSTSATAR